MNQSPEPGYVDVIADSESFNLFEAVGFDVIEERDFFDLFDYAEKAGVHSIISRESYALHGSCWKLSDGLEIWSFSFIAGDVVEYEDCRPAFRSRYTHILQPWELIEYEEGGDAILRGTVQDGVEVIFQLQNLTELSIHAFDFPHLHVAFAGLAYAVDVSSGSYLKREKPVFELIRKPAQRESEFYIESDYFVRGRVLAWRYFRNPITDSDLAWIYVDAGSLRLEILVNRHALHGRLRVGAAVTAKVWLQGYVLGEADLEARYEGVDPDAEKGDFWAALRRHN